MLIWVGVFQTLLVSQLLGAFQFPDPGEDRTCGSPTARETLLAVVGQSSLTNLQLRAANVPFSHGVLCCFPLLQVLPRVPCRSAPLTPAAKPQGLAEQ